MYERFSKAKAISWLVRKSKSMVARSQLQPMQQWMKSGDSTNPEYHWAIATEFNSARLCARQAQKIIRGPS